MAPTAVSTTNGFLIRLDPPEPLVLEGTLKSTQTTKVGIYDLHDPTDKSYSGSVKCTWSDLGTWRVKVPHGIHEARLIKVEYNGSIGPASVNAQRYMFFGKGVGPIAFTDMRDISAFLIINVDTNKAGVLESWEALGSEKKTEKPKAD